MYQSGSSYNSEVTWEVKDSEDNLIASGSSNGSWEGCLPNGTYTVYGYDSWGDGWNGGNFYVNGPIGLIAAIDLVPTGSSGTADFEIDINYAAVYGCTDATALNYDATATEDDGSCYYVGDVCASPFPGTGDVTGGEPGWYQFTLPAAAGILTVTMDDPYGDIMAVTSCDYDPYYPNYTGIINYAYSLSLIHI